MSWDIAFGGDPEDLVVTARGVASPEGLAKMVEAIVTRPEFRPGLRWILDYTDLDWRTMTEAALRQRAQANVRSAELIGKQRIAVVTPSKTEIGLLRMMEAYAGGSFGFEVDIFPTYDDARAWLRTDA